MGSAIFVDGLCMYICMYRRATCCMYQYYKIMIFAHCSFTGGIIAAVCTCQVSVVMVAIVTGLVVHFVTKCVLFNRSATQAKTEVGTLQSQLSQ